MCPVRRHVIPASPHRHLNDKTLTVGADVSISHERIRNPEESTRCSCLKGGCGSDIHRHDVPVARQKIHFLSILPPSDAVGAAFEVCDLDSGTRRSSRLVGIKWPHVNLRRANIDFVRQVRQKASVR